MVYTVNRKSTTVKRSIEHFTDLDAWKINHEIALDIYKLTRKYPKDELFGLTSQARRAATSVTSNVAEGWGRYHYGDKTNFYYQARGSNAELQNLLTLARDLGYITNPEFEKVYAKAQQGFQVISGLIRSTEQRRNK